MTAELLQAPGVSPTPAAVRWPHRRPVTRLRVLLPPSDQDPAPENKDRGRRPPSDEKHPRSASERIRSGSPVLVDWPPPTPSDKCPAAAAHPVPERVCHVCK